MPMQETAVENGHPCWVDLSTDDVGVAERFYRELLGWQVTVDRTPMGEYHVATVGGRDVAGMMSRSPEMAGTPPMWTLFFYVVALEPTLEAVGAAGGTVLQAPFAIPGGARVSVVADAGGAMFALISARPQPGPYLTADLGAVSWVELMTRRPDEAVAFYRRVFGWRATSGDAGDVTYTTFDLDGSPIGGMVRTPEHLPDAVPDSWSVYFGVADCAATAKLAPELGGAVILPPTATPAGPFAVLADPTGAVFQVMQTDAAIG